MTKITSWTQPSTQSCCPCHTGWRCWGWCSCQRTPSAPQVPSTIAVHFPSPSFTSLDVAPQLSPKSLLPISTTLRRIRLSEIGRPIVCQFTLCLACMWLAACGRVAQGCFCGWSRQLIELSSIRLLGLQWSGCLIFIFFPFRLGFRVCGLRKGLRHRIFCRGLL